MRKLIDEAISLLKTNEDFRKASEATSYFRELRTITLGVPRGSGKTTAILEMMTENCLVHVHNHRLKSYLIEKNGEFPPNQILDFSGDTSILLRAINITINPENIIKYFLIDEYSYMSTEAWHNTLRIAERLDVQGKLDKDFFILRLGT
jgi:hypothetical protein